MTQEAFNQVEPLVHVNLFDGNRAMQDALRINAPTLDTAPLHAQGLENAPEAFMGLLKGKNFGKQLVKLI